MSRAAFRREKEKEFDSGALCVDQTAVSHPSCVSKLFAEIHQPGFYLNLIQIVNGTVKKKNTTLSSPLALLTFEPFLKSKTTSTNIKTLRANVYIYFYLFVFPSSFGTLHQNMHTNRAAEPLKEHRFFFFAF